MRSATKASIFGMQSIDRDADIRRSEELVIRALAADPTSYHARHAKARLLVAQKRAEEALIEAERSLRLNPGFIPSYLVLCQANLMLGLPDNAIEHVERIGRIRDDDAEDVAAAAVQIDREHEHQVTTDGFLRQQVAVFRIPLEPWARPCR